MVAHFGWKMITQNANAMLTIPTWQAKTTAREDTKTWSLSLHPSAPVSQVIIIPSLQLQIEALCTKTFFILITTPHTMTLCITFLF